MGEAYRDLIRDWTEVLPTQSVCLQVPLALDDDYPGLAEPSAHGASDSDTATGAPGNTD